MRFPSDLMTHRALPNLETKPWQLSEINYKQIMGAANTGFSCVTGDIFCVKWADIYEPI